MANLTFDRYPFLKDLHLAPENLGCFDGEWFASGDFITSTRLNRLFSARTYSDLGISPTTGEPICRIKAATKDDYERLLTKMSAAIKGWQAVRPCSAQCALTLL